jgi:hypothetical protein
MKTWITPDRNSPNRSIGESSRKEDQRNSKKSLATATTSIS